MSKHNIDKFFAYWSERVKKGESSPFSSLEVAAIECYDVWLHGSSDIENLKCPDCGLSMVSRKNNKDGTRFWGCSAFPQCRGTRDSEGKSKAEREAERTQKDLEKKPDFGYPQESGFSFKKG
jgi:Topoisomerase DNA binding C4 zinc finger